jgi:hypothetical protein
VVNKPDTAPGVVDKPDTAPGVVDKPDTAPGVVDKPDTAPGVVNKPDTAPGVVDKPDTAPGVVDKPDITVDITPVLVVFVGSCVLEIEGTAGNEGVQGEVDEFEVKSGGPPRLMGASLGVVNPLPILFSSVGSCGMTNSRHVGMRDPMPRPIILSWAEKEGGREKESRLSAPILNTENEEVD